MTQDQKPAVDPRPADSDKAEASLLKQILARLKEVDAKLDRMQLLLTEQIAAVAKEQAGVREGIEAASRNFLSLQAIVVNALPSRLLRLTAEHIALLREKAPSAKVRLIHRFQTGLINLGEGHVLDVTDNRVKIHGEAMHLALVVGVDSDVDVIVKRLVDEQVRELARLEDLKVKAQAEDRLRMIEAQAADLRAQARG